MGILGLGGGRKRLDSRVSFKNSGDKRELLGGGNCGGYSLRRNLSMSISLFVFLSVIKEYSTMVGSFFAVIISYIFANKGIAYGH